MNVLTVRFAKHVPSVTLRTINRHKIIYDGISWLIYLYQHWLWIFNMYRPYLIRINQVFCRITHYCQIFKNMLSPSKSQISFFWVCGLWHNVLWTCIDVYPHWKRQNFDDKHDLKKWNLVFVTDGTRYRFGENHPYDPRDPLLAMVQDRELSKRVGMDPI